MSPSTPTLRLALRTDARNPDHHLWNNNGTWWCHATVHLPDFTKRRLRASLRTDDIGTARRRRDAWIARLADMERRSA